MIARLKNLFGTRLPQLPPDQWRALHRQLTMGNVYRLRLLAWLAAGLNLVLIYFDWSMFQIAGPAADYPHLWAYQLSLRLLTVAGALAYLAAVGRPADASRIGRRHRILVTVVTLYLLVAQAALTALIQPFQVGVAPYLIGVMVMAAFVRLPGRRSLAVYSLTWLALAGLLLYFQRDLVQLSSDLLNSLCLTGLALILNRIIYVGRLKELWNQQELTKRQQELQEVNQALERMSYWDALTGVPNRRQLDEYLEREWKRAAREKAPLSFLMIDIDHFKDYNDAYGHQAGDDCLVRVAATLEAVGRRPGDLLARYGGEEFLAVLAGTSVEAARLLGERMRRAVLELNIAHAGSPQGRVTVSLGLASMVPVSGSGPGGLLDAADRAMYRAKHQGRNRLAWAA